MQWPRAGGASRPHTCSATAVGGCQKCDAQGIAICQTRRSLSRYWRTPKIRAVGAAKNSKPSETWDGYGWRQSRERGRESSDYLSTTSYVLTGPSRHTYLHVLLAYLSTQVPFRCHSTGLLSSTYMQHRSFSMRDKCHPIAPLTPVHTRRLLPHAHTRTVRRLLYHLFGFLATCVSGCTMTPHGRCIQVQ